MVQQGEHFDAGLSRGNFFGLGGVNISSKVWGNAMISRENKLKKNSLKIECTNRYNYAATIPSEAG